MNPKAKELRNAYKRKWYVENKEKQKDYNQRYWERKIKELANAQ